MKEKMNVKLTAEHLRKKRLMMKFIMICITILLLFLSTVYAVIYIVNQTGNFTISLDPNLKAAHSISMSPFRDFRQTSILLKADALEYMDNITESWLPDDLDEQEGEHSQDNYLAYTFFLRNDGLEAIDYEAAINIQSVIKGVDEAVRVKVYHNGEKTIYAKPQKETNIPEPNTTPFVSNTVIMHTSREKFSPGDIDRFTIVIWLEGEDPECIDDIIGGEMKMIMLIRKKATSTKTKK